VISCTSTRPTAWPPATIAVNNAFRNTDPAIASPPEHRQHQNSDKPQ